MRRLRSLALVAAAAACMLPWASRAQDEAWPSRPVTLIVSSGPGAGVDTFARLLAERLQPRLGQSVIVENRPGASGMIAARQAARSAPDGYTLFLMPNTLVIAPYVLAQNAATVNVMKELAPVVMPVSTIYDLLASNAIDAGITTEVWAPGVHPDIDFLFPDHGAEERAYFARTRCFPIMHTLLVRTSILEAHPWVAQSLYDAWEASKQACYRKQEEWARIHTTSLWYRALWEEERRAAGPDIYPWGFAKTRHEVDRMLAYAHRQGLTPRKYEPEEMFWPSMLQT